MDDDESQQQSADFIEQLVKANYSGAFREKAIRYVKHAAEAVSLLAKSADLGDAQEMAAIGVYLASGMNVPRTKTMPTPNMK